jgi:hypothetical protein
MSVHLIKTVETYRCDTETEAKDFIESQRHSGIYILEKHSSEIKSRKEKGEIVDEWYRVSVTKSFDDEKEPIKNIDIINYGKEED